MKMAPCVKFHPEHRDGAREEMLGGAKTVRVPTASEASKTFTGHTFQIGLKCNYTL